MINNNKMVI